ncbi:hypothetical protein AOPFMNJM_1519 [Methylobacterium jeotgali]|uniref:Uncharacterized protein n=1 Tax=Methylobacterium jeotgali TaxID=381630 RepID=A0ABQ4SUR0_9HYPH|nr:hypothetical protein AOPFMNJM_1519 [Methylobacterium jeotgali]
MVTVLPAIETAPPDTAMVSTTLRSAILTIRMLPEPANTASSKVRTMLAVREMPVALSVGFVATSVGGEPSPPVSLP